MSAPLLYITGTNTGVGKTTLACLLLRRARERSLQVAAMKPFCSGGREDAEQLHALQVAGLTLDEVNPFWFAEPVAPYVAAKNENRHISARDTTDAIRKITARGLPLLIEGAGGVMSPLGERFTLLEIIRELPGCVCGVGTNVLGVINGALSVHFALKGVDLRFVLMNPRVADASAGTNADVIREWTGAPTFQFPFLQGMDEANVAAAAVLDSLLDWWIAGK
jgi:dethiobiotin synthetase